MILLMMLFKYSFFPLYFWHFFIGIIKEATGVIAYKNKIQPLEKKIIYDGKEKNKVINLISSKHIQSYI